jgi:hypothetical protein
LEEGDMKILWNNSAGGNFNSAANWAFAGVPGPADIAAMTLSGTYTVSSDVSNTDLGFTTGAGTTLAITGSSTFTATQGTATGINGGHVVVADGSTLVAGGTINNTNQIVLSAAGHATKFLVLSPLTLKGGGLVSLSADSHNLISAIGGNAVLTNVDNQIAGAGTVNVPLVNETSGIINANVASVPLTIEVVSNGGVLEASNGAELLLESPLRGSGGVIKALSGSKVVIEDAMIDGGTLLTSGTGVISATGSLVQMAGNGGHAVVNSGALHVDALAGLQTQGAFTNSGIISVDTSCERRAYSTTAARSFSGMAPPRCSRALSTTVVRSLSVAQPPARLCFSTVSRTQRRRAASP